MFEQQQNIPVSSVGGNIPAGAHPTGREFSLTDSNVTHIHGAQVTALGCGPELSKDGTWTLVSRVLNTSGAVQQTALKPRQAAHATPNRASFMTDERKYTPDVRVYGMRSTHGDDQLHSINELPVMHLNLMDSGSPLPITLKRPVSVGVRRPNQSVSPTHCKRRLSTRGMNAKTILMMQKSPWRAAR